MNTSASPDTSNSARSKHPNNSQRRGKRPSFLKVVRRVHLYMGLLMIPWVLFFGITALSFNHPTVGRGLKGQMLPPQKLEALTGVRAWDPSKLANSVAEELGDDADKFSLVADSAHFQGWPIFSRKAAGGPQVVIVGLDQGRAILTKRKEAQQSERPPFFGKQVTLPVHNMNSLAEQLSVLHEKMNLTVEGPLRPHPKVHPQLRFVAKGPDGKRWNVLYDLTTGTLDGRPSEEARHAPFVELLESLHTQHHFPANFGPTFFWALFADLTALMLIIWATTGLLMWWQMKKLRAVGLTVLLFAGVIATAVMTSTASELTFGPERGGGGP